MSLRVTLLTSVCRSAMPIKCLKKAVARPQVSKDEAPAIVRTMLAEIEAGGEARVLQYAKDLDGWEGEIL